MAGVQNEKFTHYCLLLVSQLNWIAFTLPISRWVKLDGIAKASARCKTKTSLITFCYDFATKLDRL